jgi:very-short-patch-repair endonuclease
VKVMPWGSDGVGFWARELTTLSELLVQAGNQRAARLLSLVQDTDEADPVVGEQVRNVVLRVRPIFLDLFRPADLDAVADQMDKLVLPARHHKVTVAAMLADPFAKAELGGTGTLTIQLREAIADALYPVRSYDLPEVCQSFGLAQGEGQEAFASKRGYVRSRISGYNQDQLLELGTRVVESHYLPQLWGLLQILAVSSPRGRSAFKNLIFAADGPKPELVLADAVSNTIEIVANAQFCLVYDRPLDDAGLSWADLVAWWTQTHAPEGTSDRDAANDLYYRLARSLDAGRPPSNEPGPESLMFEVYAKLLKQHGFHLPALVPQVYLHYDPYTRTYRRKTGPLARQRMDFLMLLRGRRRVVIEIDGIQHYAVGKQASPERYAAMVAEDRKLYLDGYEVVRFGGDEFRAADNARATVNAFFTQLLTMHGYLDQARQ